MKIPAKNQRVAMVLLGFSLVFGVSFAVAQSAVFPATPWDEATLYRDDYGVPHVQAVSVRGMAFAFGYAQAGDHLEPMLMAYRVALGRAAVVGGEQFAEGDAFALKIDNAEVSRAAMAEADGITRDLCEGFALGINTWIFDHKDQVPSWVEGVQPMDVLAYWHFLMVTSAPFDLPGIYHPERPLQRANAWALAPSNTVDGKALLVMAPYQYYRAPYQWYEAHLMVEDMNWYGATLLGVPVLMMGHNAHLGWTLTPNETDFADFFRENMDGQPEAPRNPNIPNNPSRHTIMQGPAPLLRFMETAKTYYVRTGAGLVERSVPSYVGSRGPMMSGNDGAVYSWRNGAFGQFGGLRQLMAMALAPDMAAFQEALLYQQLPCFQILYADQTGNIFYFYNARTGNRNGAISEKDTIPIDWSKPQDGLREPFAWETLVLPGALPAIVNPASGYLQACGTPPWLATRESGLVADDWPRWLVPEESSYRAFRVDQILSTGIFTLPDMAAMLYDTYVPAAGDMVPLLLAMAEARPDLLRMAHPDLVTGLTLLQHWNLSSDRDSEALVFYTRWWALMKARYQENFESEDALYRALMDDTNTAQSYALEVANDVARSMRNDFNRLAIPWGEVHRLRRGGRDDPVFGAGVGDSIFMTRGPAAVNGRSPVNFGYGFAMAVEFGEIPQALSIVPFGASGNSASSHYSDQMTLFLERRMKSTYFSYDAVIRNATVGHGRYIVLGTPGLEGTCTFAIERPGTVSLEAVNYPPRPYPGGQEPFTPTVRPVLAEDGRGLSWELEWTVPASVCTVENLPRLRFYTYTREGGWEPLLRQRFEDDDEVFVGAGSGAVMIALMGPSRMREKAEPVEVPPESVMPPASEEKAVMEEDRLSSGAFTWQKRMPPEAPVEEPTSQTEMPTDESPDGKVLPAAPQMNRPTRQLYDVEIVGGPAAGAEEPPAPPRKKGLGRLLKKFRNK